MLRSWQCTLQNQGVIPHSFRLFSGISIPEVFNQGSEVGASANQVTTSYKEES